MKEWKEIRQQVLVNGMSQREAKRKYGLGWETLKKILAHSEPPGYRQKEARPRRVLAPVLPIIHEILEADRKAPKKQRHTAKRIFERLKAEYGYLGGKTVVEDAVRAWRQTHQAVFLPLVHPPGEAQVDFGEATIRQGGVERKVALFVMTLPYSGALFVQAFPRECTETFLEGHRLAFEFFGGVPTRISYDNTAIAVIEVLQGRERKLTKEFLRLQSHYLFQEHFCLVRTPNEKGHVERLIGFARRNFLVPVPEISSFEVLNEHLHERCVADRAERTRGKTGTKEDLLKEDQSAFLPQPKQAFESRRVDHRTVDSQSLVRFDDNEYSVPVQYAHRKVTFVATVHEVRFVFDDRLIAKHPRCWERERTFFEPIHYLVLVSTESNFEARGNDGSFMRLFGYISGKNESKQKIEMTTPVFMEPGKSEQKGKMSFVMPLSIAQAGAPEPNASNVTIGRRMGGRFAVIRFSGVMDAAKAEAHERKLREWMAARGLESEGIAERAGYDPPFTPAILRRNEVLIRIKPPMVAPQSDSPAGP